MPRCSTWIAALNQAAWHAGHSRDSQPTAAQAEQSLQGRQGGVRSVSASCVMSFKQSLLFVHSKAPLSCEGPNKQHV